MTKRGMNEGKEITIQDLLKQEFHDKIGNKSREEQLTWYINTKEHLQSFTDPEIQLIIEAFEKIIELQNQLKAMDQQVPTQGQENEDTKETQTIEEQIKEAKEKIATLTQEVAKKKCKLESINNNLQELQTEKQELELERMKREKIIELKDLYEESNNLRKKQIKALNNLLIQKNINQKAIKEAKDIIKTQQDRTYVGYIETIHEMFNEIEKGEKDAITITHTTAEGAIQKALTDKSIKPEGKNTEYAIANLRGDLFYIQNKDKQRLTIKPENIEAIQGTNYSINKFTSQQFSQWEKDIKQAGEQTKKDLQEKIAEINKKIKAKKEEISKRREEKEETTREITEKENEKRQQNNKITQLSGQRSLQQLQQTREEGQQRIKRKQIEKNIADQRTKIETEDITLQLFDLNKIKTAYQKKVLEVLKSNPNVTEEEFHNQTKNTITSSFTRKEIYQQIEDRRTLVKNIIATKQEELIDTLNNSGK